ncbi:hypothetical protein NON00_15105 [Roseomonas sp. GC11]|uniref:hypothetical protein n=1 Tax=Roseomonas sp. GC11 TaxID=2950546 RepID=UPI00210DEED6|nr:hypothetical protein [Roseomonas sp. GC11]MCQ4161251.1 hypothetical protein [Roseomonas sp. GC11]
MSDMTSLPSLGRRCRRGLIRTQLLVLLLLSASSGYLAQQLGDQADRLAAAYQDIAEDPPER